MDSLIKNYVRSNQFHGAVLVAHKGQVILHNGYGYKEVSGKSVNDPNSIFQIGSVTKQFTAALILKLQEAGKLNVSDKLSKWFPDFPNGDKITIEHLLTHTSGIYNYTREKNFMEKEVDKPKSQQNMISMFSGKPLDFEPGEKWSYSNSGYLMLGYIAEKAGGKPYEQLIHQYIFSPLQMNSSGFDFTHLKNSWKANGYSFINNDSSRVSMIVDSSVSGAAGAIYSNTGDLFKWAKTVWRKDLLSEESWNAAFTPKKNNYGYGWIIDSLAGKPVYGHSGGIHGFNSNIAVFPNDSSVIILLSNVNTGSLEKLTKDLASVLYNIETVKELTLDENILKSYEGDYILAPQFILNVKLENGNLTVQPTGQPRLEMFAETETKFFLKVVDAKFEFQKDSSGKVTGLTLFQGGREMPAKRSEKN